MKGRNILKKDSLKTIYRKNPDVVSRNIAGETVLVPISEKTQTAGRLFTLNEVGAFIWESIDGEESVEGILNRILDRYDVGEKSASADLVELIESMERCGMIFRRE